MAIIKTHFCCPNPPRSSDMLTHMGKDIHNNELLEMVKDIVPHPDPDEGLALQMTANLPDPRTIKTHLPFSLVTPDLLDTAKVSLCRPVFCVISA